MALLKGDCKILVSFGLIQNLEILNLAMMKIEKVTYSLQKLAKDIF
jgi:hypothetical protein